MPNKSNLATIAISMVCKWTIGPTHRSEEKHRAKVAANEAAHDPKNGLHGLGHIQEVSSREQLSDWPGNLLLTSFACQTNRNPVHFQYRTGSSVSILGRPRRGVTSTKQSMCRARIVIEESNIQLVELSNLAFVRKNRNDSPT